MDLHQLSASLRRKAAADPRERDLLINPSVENVGDYLVEKIETQPYRADYFKKFLDNLLAKRRSPLSILDDSGIILRVLDAPSQALRRALERELGRGPTSYLMNKAVDLAVRCVEHHRDASLTFDYLNTYNDLLFSGKIAFKTSTLKFALGPIRIDPVASTYRGPSYVATKSSDGAPPTREQL